MKRLTIISVLLSLSLALGAQGIDLLDRVPGNRVCLDYTVTGESVNLSGKLTVEDNSYILESAALSVLSDGKSRITLDSSSREAVIESVPETDPASNPALLVASYKSFGDRIRLLRSGKDYLVLRLRMENGDELDVTLKNIAFSRPEGLKTSVEDIPEGYYVTDLR